MSIIVSYVNALLSRRVVIRLGVVDVVEYVQKVARLAEVRHLAFVEPLNDARRVACQLSAL